MSSKSALRTGNIKTKDGEHVKKMSSNGRKRARKSGGCYHCGSDNHRARVCPDAVCRICGSRGHDAGGCTMKSKPPVDLGKFNFLSRDQDVNKREGAVPASASACQSPAFTYIELFAGMGGFRVALDKFGGKCVFSSEVDRFCKKNYEENFGDRPAGDICRIPSDKIPHHDLLVGGFPCQPFSSSGSRLGVDDPSGRGVLFREIVRILKDKAPRMFLLENVRGLFLHNDGSTLKLIVKELEECGYFVKHEMLDAVNILPQERCRLFLAGIRKYEDEDDGDDYVARNRKAIDFSFPSLPDLKRGIADIIHDPKDFENDELLQLEMLILNPNQLEKVRSQKYTQQHPEARFLTNLSMPSKTIQSSYMKYMVGSQFIQVKNKTEAEGDENHQANSNQWRRFSSREVARLQGFPEDFKLCRQRAHHMVGNAVSPPVIAMIVAPLLQHHHLCRHQLEKRDIDDNKKYCNRDDSDNWGWNITKSLLIKAAPNDSRRKDLETKLLTVKHL